MGGINKEEKKDAAWPLSETITEGQTDERKESPQE